MHQSPENAIREERPLDARIVRMSARTHLAFVVRPNGADVFVHTWNPSAARLVSTEYGSSLVAALHERINRSLPKARSQALSIGRAAQLMRGHERRHVHAYQMALVMRNDLVLGEHLAMEEFTPAFLWFATICCERQARERRQKAALAQACGSSPSLAETASMQHSLVGHCTLDSQAS